MAFFIFPIVQVDVFNLECMALGKISHIRIAHNGLTPGNHNLFFHFFFIIGCFDFFKEKQYQIISTYPFPFIYVSMFVLFI